MTTMRPLLLRNASLYGGGSDPVDVIVSAGTVAAILPAGQGSARQVHDLDGRHVLAGLWDHHVHLTQYALARRRIDLASANSAAAVARLVADAVRDDPPGPGEPVMGFGFRDALWSDAPHRALLDEVCPDIPLALASGDLHCVWLNSAGLALAGATDHPTGLLREEVVPAVLDAFQRVAVANIDALVLEAVKRLPERGIVGVVELENQRNPEVWPARAASAPVRLRIECAVYPDELDWAIAAGLRTGDPLTADGLLRMGPLKVITDGSLNTRTAYCDDAYPGLAGAEARGLLLVPPQDLEPILRLAHEHGIFATVHAIGDHANALALDAFAAVGCPGRIEHAQLVRPADFARFAQLGIEASVQPRHAIDDRDVADRHWSGRTDRSFAYASLHTAGARLRLGSDAPVAPLDPWISLQSAALRTADDRASWHPEQEMSVAAGLDASTPSGARVTVGMPADLVVVDNDPRTSPPTELGSTPVHATMIAGSWSWLDGEVLADSGG